MGQSSPGYGLAVAALIVGIVSLPLIPLCGLGILTAIVGLVLAVIARRAAVQAPGGAAGLATAGIVVNGVLVVLAAVVIAIYGVAILGVAAARSARNPKPSASGAGTFGSAAPMPSSAAMPSPVTDARLGDSARVGDLVLAVLAYNETEKCPGGDGRAAQGAKFVLVQARMRNAGADVIHVPQVRWTLGKFDERSGVLGGPCFGIHALSTACYAPGSGRLFPGVQCEGSVLFEVPVALAVDAEPFKAEMGSYDNRKAVVWRATP